MKTFSPSTYLFLSHLLFTLTTAHADNLPNLQIATDASADLTTEVFGGISINQGPYQPQVTQYVCDDIVVAGQLTIDPHHVGQVADILVRVEYTLPSAPNTVYHYTLDEGLKSILVWDQVPAHLATFIPKAAVESIAVAKEEALIVLANEREKIMRMTHKEALSELVRVYKIEKRIKLIKSVSDNGLLEIR